VGKGGYVCAEVGTGDSATDAAADEISAQVASHFVVLTAANAATADVPIWLTDERRKTLRQITIGTSGLKEDLNLRGWKEKQENSVYNIKDG
jgi:hypothetical protein